MKDLNKIYCYHAALQVFIDCRVKLIHDSLYVNSFIKCGLHEENKEVQKIYFERYFVEWLDIHWNTLINLLDSNKTLSKDYKNDCIKFFVKYFIRMIEEFQDSEYFAQFAIPNLLQIKKRSLEELLHCSERLEEKYNQLEADLKQHDDLFKQELEKYLHENQ